MNPDTKQPNTPEQPYEPAAPERRLQSAAQARALAGEAPDARSQPSDDEALAGRGKIARLPRPVREALNQKLRDGEEGPVLLKWLNSLPETRKLLRQKFKKEPISQQNLSRWVQKGYRDWLRKQEAFEQMRQSMEEPGHFDEGGAKNLTERLAQWLAMRCLLEAHRLEEAGADPDLGVFGRLCRSLTSLRRGDHSVRRLDLDAARLKLEEQTRPGSKRMEDLFWEWTKRPDIREKLFPKPPTPEEQMREYRQILGMNPDVESPGEKYWREEREAWTKEYLRRRAAGQGPTPTNREQELDSDTAQTGGHSAEANEGQGLPEL